MEVGCRLDGIASRLNEGWMEVEWRLDRGRMEVGWNWVEVR